MRVQCETPLSGFTNGWDTSQSSSSLDARDVPFVVFDPGVPRNEYGSCEEDEYGEPSESAGLDPLFVSCLDPFRVFLDVVLLAEGGGWYEHSSGMPAARHREQGSSLSHLSFLRWQGMQTKTRLLRRCVRTKVSGVRPLRSEREKVVKYPAGMSDVSLAIVPSLSTNTIGSVIVGFPGRVVRK